MAAQVQAQKAGLALKDQLSPLPRSNPSRPHSPANRSGLQSPVGLNEPRGDENGQIRPLSDAASQGHDESTDSALSEEAWPEVPGQSTDTTSDDRTSEEKQLIRQDIENMEAQIAGLSLYKIVDKIGEGTFSSVYKAIDTFHDYYDNFVWTHKIAHPPVLSNGQPRQRNRVYVALKRIYVTSSPDRIANELEIMEQLRDCPNIAYLVSAFRTEDQIVAVMPYSRHVDFRHYYRTISMDGLREYLRCLFLALASCHEHHVIHRDVKPANFLFDPRSGEGTLCDFGLAERFEPSEWRGKCHHTCPTAENPRGTVAINTQVYSVHTLPGGDLDPSKHAFASSKRANKPMGPPQKVERVGVPEHDKRSGVRANRAGTRGFRAPEVLLKCQDQTPAVDIWSAGIILLAFLTKRFPMFNANTDTEALLELMVVFGKAKIARAALLHNRTFHCTVPVDNPEGWRIPDFIEHLNPAIWDAPRGHPDPDLYQDDVRLAMDLCRVCLHVDVTRRWTAEEVLNHSFLREADSD